jgi:hypothetical protein
MRLAILSIVAMMLTGCGAAQKRRGTAELDEAKMTRVEQVALARGVKVIWVNPPMAKSP